MKSTDGNGTPRKAVADESSGVFSELWDEAQMRKISCTRIN